MRDFAYTFMHLIPLLLMFTVMFMAGEYIAAGFTLFFITFIILTADAKIKGKKNSFILKAVDEIF